MTNYLRKAFLLHVDLDSVPGTFHTPRSASENIQGMLTYHFTRYMPVVVFGVAHPEEQQKSYRKRVCFVIFMDMDPYSGSDNPEVPARSILQAIFNNRIPHYNPQVELAPDNLQPESIARGLRV